MKRSLWTLFCLAFAACSSDEHPAGMDHASGGAGGTQGGATVAQGGATVAQGGATVAQGGATVAQGGATVAQGGASGEPAVDRTESFARLDERGNILGVGVVIPVSSFEEVPSTDPAFQTSVGIEMPDSVRDKTFIQLLRINWLAGGHGPEPYHAPHFDLHFYRGTKDEVTAISCPEPGPFPEQILASGYEAPSTCVSGMGYHAWPTEDIQGNPFSASIILGYAAQKMVFIEPMITQEFLLARQSFERPITRPASAGGSPTLFPSHFTATYSSATDTYRFEFNQFEPID